mgnify:CR=1 FL=1
MTGVQTCALPILESSTGDLVINVADMAEDEQVEVEITLSGTIYEVTI